MSKHADKPTPGDKPDPHKKATPEDMERPREAPDMGTALALAPPTIPGVVMCDFHPNVPAMPGKKFCHDCFREWPKTY